MNITGTVLLIYTMGVTGYPASINMGMLHVTQKQCEQIAVAVKNYPKGEALYEVACISPNGKVLITENNL